MVSSIKWLFDYINYGNYPQNNDFGDLPIEYKQRLLTLKIIDCLTDNKVERLKVNLIKWLLYIRRYKLITKITILMTYLLMVTKGWLQDNNYIAYMILIYLVRPMVRAFAYKL